MLAGHTSGCWLSTLGAGVPYNREKNESKFIYILAVAHFLQCFPANSDGSLTKVPSLMTTGSSRCWLSALGTDVPYNRERNESKIYLFLAVAHF